MKELQAEAEQFLKEKYSMSDFNAYQRSAARTAIYPHQHKILYPALGLAGEAGEVANKVKKLIRDGPDNRPDTWREDIASEIGDVLWYCAALATDLNLTLGMIAAQNEKKLSKRKRDGTLIGSGDTR
jgi:NTP pyrophosphatase (non-canonical NTP hydrolase)|tara:strand:+ start:1211 stop:1591 length:381 start_codon:yes stop_codon:yes gene_type:complete